MKKLVLLSILLLAACSTYNGKFAAISNRPISLYTLTKDNTLVEKDANNQLSRHVIIVVPLSKAPTITAAIDQVLDRYDGDYLANATIERKSFQLMWMYHYSAWKISGDVMKSL